MDTLKRVLLVEDDPNDIELTIGALREHNLANEVVILTSSRESRDLDECYKLDVNAYVVKPVHFDEFVEAVKGISVFWVLNNELSPASMKKQ